MPRRFTLAQSRTIERASAYGGGRTVVEFVPRPDAYGTFATREAAKRAFAEAFEPELKGHSDEFIAMHFRVWSRNGFIRLVRVEV